MRLLRYEISKYCTRFNLIFLTFLLVLNIVLTAAEYRSYFTSDNRGIIKLQDEMISLSQNEPEKYAEIYAAHTKKVEKYNEDMRSFDLRFPIFENEYSNYDGYGDMSLFSDVNEAVSRQKSYENKLRLLLRDAVTRLRETDEDSYFYSYYVELCRFYTPLTEEKLSSDMVRGWNEFFSQDITTVLIAIAVASTLCTVFTCDSDAGMSGIQRTAKYGGKPLRRAKLSFVALASAAITLVFTLTPLIVFSLSCGLSSLSEPVQSVDALVLCPYSLTIGEYLCAYLALRVLFFGIFSLIGAVSAQFFDNYRPALVICAAIAVIGALTSGINQSSALYSLTKFSPGALANVNILFERYRGINFFRICLNYTIVTIVSATVLAVIICFISVRRDSRKVRVYRKAKIEADSLEKAHPQPLYRTEFYKHIICGRYFIVILAAILLKTCISAVIFSPSKSSTEKQYMKYIGAVEGVVSAEKYDYIKEEQDYINRSIAEYDAAQTDYRLEKITADEFEGYKKRYYYANFCENACKKLVQRMDYLRSVEADYPDVQFVYDEGLDRYFGVTSDLSALFAIILVFSCAFSLEYESGFASIMRVSKNGRKVMWRTKLLYTLTLGAVLFILLHGTAFLILTRSYDIGFLDAPIQSMPRFSDIKSSMTVGEYLAAYEAVSLLGYLLTSIVAAAFSTICGKQLSAVVCSFLLIGVPHFVRILGVVGANILDYCDMLTPQNAVGDLLSRILCLISALTLTVLSYRKWVRK